MKLATLEAIFRSLAAADVRYVVVGGVAVNAHGYLRATMDLDLVVGLAEDNVRHALAAFAALGYRPQVPVALEDFADAALREMWAAERNMQVFSLVSDTHADTTVDLFVSEPFDFTPAYDASDRVEIAAGVDACILNLPALIAMKRTAGRDRDRDDVEHLTMLREESERGMRDG